MKATVVFSDSNKRFIISYLWNKIPQSFIDKMLITNNLFYTGFVFVSTESSMLNSIIRFNVIDEHYYCCD